MIEIISKYFPELTKNQLEKFEKLEKLYKDWNSKINVISRKDIDNLYEHHILHSLVIGKIIKFNTESKILDVGTGGGLPGIPLSIIFRESNFMLVDSIGKKIKVVESIKEELQLENVKALHARAEQVNDKFDFVISRAVTDLPLLYEWVKTKFLKRNLNELNNGIICLKGGDLKNEIRQFGNKCRIYNISDYFTEEYFADKKVVYIEL